jgi:thioesterase domain-containing protein
VLAQHHDRRHGQLRAQGRKQELLLEVDVAAERRDRAGQRLDPAAALRRLGAERLDPRVDLAMLALQRRAECRPSIRSLPSSLSLASLRPPAARGPPRGR